MSDWDLRLLTTRLNFIDSIEKAGFRQVHEDAWEGSVHSASGKRYRVRLVLGSWWPYLHPVVAPLDGEHADSWHCDPAGGLCLYVDDDRTRRPWLDVPAFLARIAAWFDNAEAGWPDDSPDLDLERYFSAATPRMLVLYDDLDLLVNKPIRTRRTRNNTVEVLGAGTVPRKARRRRYRFGYCADIGTPAKPPKTWKDLEVLIPEGPKVARGIRDGTYHLLVLRYTRSGQTGVVAMSTFVTDDDEIALRAHDSASRGAAVRMLRAGPDASALADKRVAVVGCGAVGSFVVEGLVRSGITDLTLQDGDVLRPGNLIRHVAGEAQIGLSKPDAVQHALVSRGLLTTDIRKVHERLTDPDAARNLIRQHDLVIDATADGAATSLLHDAAKDTGAHVLSVCTQNDGDTVRVDLLPPLNHAAPLPETVQRDAHGPAIYEGGCGDPVSPTPPYAVIQAAALAVRHASAFLRGSPLHDSGEIRDYARVSDD